MTTHKGNAGLVKIGANTVAEMVSWTVTQTEGTVEDTALGDAARTYVADGLPTWTASINAHYDESDTTGQALIVPGASLSLVFDPYGTGTGNATLTGTGLVTSVQFGEVSNGTIVPFTAQLQGAGALTRAVL